MTSLLNSTSLVFAFIITPSTTIIPSNLECKNKIEDIDLLAKESFFCFRMKKHQEKEMNTCLVECKRIDDKPLGYGLSGWVIDNDDSGKRRAFAFAQNADPILKTYPGPCFIHIREIPFSYGKLGGSVWYASIALAQYLSCNTSIIKDKKVLELGAGVGIPGILAAKCNNGARSVTLTEFGLEGEVDGIVLETDNKDDKRLLPSALLSNLVYNADINGVSDIVTIRHLDWYDYCADADATTTSSLSSAVSVKHQQFTNDKHIDDNDDDDDDDDDNDNYDLVIGADLVNWEDDVMPLIETLKYFLSKNSNAEALIALSGENRRALPDFLDSIKKEFSTVNVMDASLIHYDEHPILIIALKNPF